MFVSRHPTQLGGTIERSFMYSFLRFPPIHFPQTATPYPKLKHRWQSFICTAETEGHRNSHNIPMKPYILLAILRLQLYFFKSLGFHSPDHTKIDIFVLSGQSNMSGRGGVFNFSWDRFLPPECRPNPSILRLDSRRHWKHAHEPLHSDIDTEKVCGVGPGMAFANTVLKHYPCPEKAVIGLVPCAIGGTAIRDWEKGSMLYNMMISRTKSARKNGVLRALLWYQGESDALCADTAESYKRNLQKLAYDIRSDLKQPDMLFIQVAINVDDETPTELVQKVREAQLSINMTNVFTVDAKGLPLKPDKLHLTTEAEVQLGKMLGIEYMRHATL